MRKIFGCILGGAALLFSLVTVTACGGHEGRTRYTMSAEYLPEERILNAEMTADIYNNSQSVWETLSFELYPNAYREGAKYAPVSKLYAPAAYYDGESWGGIQINSLQGGSYEIAGEDENILSVALPSALYPGERTQIKMSFSTQLAKINHRLGAGEHAVNLANFYPVLCSFSEGKFQEYVYSCYGDPFVSDCADYDVTLTLPSDLSAVCAGRVERVAQNEKTAYHVVAEGVRDVAFVLGQFECVKKDGNIPVEYYYFRDPTPERTLKAATDSLGYFSRTFSRYEYPRYVVVETDFPYGGMEYSGLSMISSNLRTEEVPLVVAHETAHQWWYAMVGSNQFTDAWQDEGLAEFSAALFLGAYPEYGGAYREMVNASEQSYRTFFSVRSQVSGEADTSMRRPLTSYSGEYEYRNLAYDKGVIMFDRIRETLGDRKFFSSLKKYAENYSGKTASGEDLISCFSSASEGLFLSFLDGICVI